MQRQNENHSIFKSIDLLGTKISLYNNKKTTIKTKIGGILSIVLIILIVLLIIGFGGDFFLRANPSFIPEIVSPSEYPQYRINNKNFSFAYRIEDKYALTFNNDSLLYVEFNQIIVQKNEDGDWVEIRDKILESRPCQAEDFGNEQKFKDKHLDTWTCPKLDNIDVGGFWDSGYVSYFMLKVKICTEGKTSFEGKKCGTNEEVEKLLSTRLYISTISHSVLINPSNYSHPLDVDYIVRYQELDGLMAKTMRMYYKEVKVETDYGWLLKDYSSESELGLHYYEVDGAHFSQTSGDKFPNTLYWLFLYFNKNLDMYHRQYTKIQDLAAQVGGILKILYIAGQFLISIYSTISFEFDLINLFFSESDKDEISKNLSKSTNEGNHAIIQNSLSQMTIKNEEVTLNLRKQDNNTMQRHSTTENSGHINNVKLYELKLKNLTEKFEERKKKYSEASSAFDSFNSYFCQLKLCACCNYKNKEKNIKFIEFASNKLKDYLEVQKIIFSQMNLEKINKIMFNEKQRMAIEQLNSLVFPDFNEENIGKTMILKENNTTIQRRGNTMVDKRTEKLEEVEFKQLNAGN